MSGGTHENYAIIGREANRGERLPGTGGGDVENQIRLVYVVFPVIGVCALEQVKYALLVVVEGKVAVFE